MRHHADTITTTTIAESIVRHDPKVNRTDEGSIRDFPELVAVVKDRLDRIAQITGVDKDQVRGGQSADLIYGYEDRLKRGVYEREDAEKLVTL